LSFQEGVLLARSARQIFLVGLGNRWGLVGVVYLRVKQGRLDLRNQGEEGERGKEGEEGSARGALGRGELLVGRGGREE